MPDTAGSGAKTLADLIAFNEHNRDREMPYFGQEIFVQAQAKGPLTDQDYLRALDKNHLLARTQGIDVVLAELRLFLDAASLVIFISALEAKLSVGPINHTARETAGVIELVTNFAARFSIGLGRGRSRFVVRLVEFVGGARSVGVDRNVDAHGIVRALSKAAREQRKPEAESDCR